MSDDARSRVRSQVTHTQQSQRGLESTGLKVGHDLDPHSNKTIEIRVGLTDDSH